MASRRQLKKVIGYVAGELLTEAVFMAGNSDRSVTEWNVIFEKILSMNNDYIARVSHKEPGMSAAAYFKNLCESFEQEAKAVVAEIQKG